MTKSDIYDLVQEGLGTLDEKALQQVLQHLDGIVFGIDKTNEKLDTLDTSLDFIAAALTGEDPVAISTAQGLGRVRPNAPMQTQQPQKTNEGKTGTMKITKAQFKQIVSEELKTLSEAYGIDWGGGPGAEHLEDWSPDQEDSERIQKLRQKWQDPKWSARNAEERLSRYGAIVYKVEKERDEDIEREIRDEPDRRPEAEEMYALTSDNIGLWGARVWNEYIDAKEGEWIAQQELAGYEAHLDAEKARDEAAEEEQRKIQGINEEKTHIMKLNYEKLAQLVKEELEVILTDEEANEMFGLKNMVQDKKLKEDCGGAHKRDDEEDDEPSPDKGGPSGTSAKKDTRPDSELRRDVKEAQLQEADVVYIAKMLLNGLLALHKAGVTPTAIIDALSGAGERERGAMVGLPGFEELPPEVQGAVGGNVAQHDQARGLAMEEGGSQYTIPPGGFGGRSHGKGSCEGECNNSQNYHQCLEDCKERKRAEQGRSSAKLDKRIGLGQWEEGKVTMSRKGLTDMIREEMARLVIIKP